MAGNLETFEDFWKAYPHCKRPPRSKKALTRGLFEQITTTGRRTKVDGIPLNIKATPEELVAAAKAYYDEVTADYEATYTDCTQYVPGSQVWLNQGRHEDFIETEEDNVHHLPLSGESQRSG